MNSKIIANGILKALLFVVGIILVLFFFWKIKSVLLYIALASVISLIGRRFVIFFNKKLKFPNTLAVIITITLFISIVGFLIALMVPLLIEQSQNIAKINVTRLIDEIQLLFADIDAYFRTQGVNIFETLDKIDLSSFVQFISVSTIFEKVINFFGSFAIGAFSTLFIAFFMLKDSALLDRMIFTLVPNHYEEKARNSWEIIIELLSSYFTGLATQVLILFVFYLILFSVFDIKNALIISFLFAMLNLIPYIGPLIKLVLITIISLTTNLGADFQTVILPTTIYVLIGYGFIQLFDNLINQPLIYSKSVKSHPLEIFIAILIFGTIFGVIGMVVAVPFYTAIRVILKEFYPKIKLFNRLLKTYK